MLKWLITLVDPQIEDYLAIPDSSFHNGQLIVKKHIYNTILSNSTVENFPKSLKQYDTVIVMNVLVYALNAFDYLETLHSKLKINGILIFHDRWFDNWVKSSKCKTAGYYTNVLQVSKPILDHFLSFYELQPFLSTNQTDFQIMRSRDWCGWKDDERGYWAVVKKIK